MSDFLPGFEASYWAGFGAPKNTPADIVDKLNAEVDAALAAPRLRARLAALGGTGLAGSPADFSKLIADETEKCAKVIRIAVLLIRLPSGVAILPSGVAIVRGGSPMSLMGQTRRDRSVLVSIRRPGNLGNPT